MTADTVKRPRVGGGVERRCRRLASAERNRASGERYPRLERLPRWTSSVSALLIYLAIAVGYFWWPIRSHFSSMAVNYGIPDLGQNLWYLKWWTYAVSHGLNPFITYKM